MTTTTNQKGDVMLSERTVATLVRFAGPLVESGMISENELETLRNINRIQAPPIEIPDLISLQETAQILKITVKTVYEHINRGELELVKLGHRTSRITVKSLHAFISGGRKSILNKEKK